MMPCHHALAEALHTYIAGIGEAERLERSPWSTLLLQ
jgi:hypothetical protein